MSATLERNEVKKAYPHSPFWAKRVDKMTDAQVIAIYLRLKREQKI